MRNVTGEGEEESSLDQVIAAWCRFYGTGSVLFGAYPALPYRAFTYRPFGAILIPQNFYSLDPLSGGPIR